MGLTTEERTNAIAQFRFTEPQARFLDLVLRHAGVCVPRQYATVAGIANGGDKCNAFFEKLVRRHYAVASDCAHNRARVYHVHYKRLYAAIGDPQSPYRRPMPPHRAIERVMLLDAVITTPGVDWLTNESEKRGCLAKVTSGGSGEAHDGRATPSRQPSSRLAGRFPVGIDAGGRLVLLYVATRRMRKLELALLVSLLETSRNRNRSGVRRCDECEPEKPTNHHRREICASHT